MICSIEMEKILRSRSSPSDRIVVFGSKPCLNKRRILKEGTQFDRWNFLNKDLCSRQVTQVRLPWFSLSKSSMIKIFLDFKGTNVMASSVSRCDCCKIFIPPDDRNTHLIYFVLLIFWTGKQVDVEEPMAGLNLNQEEKTNSCCYE